LATRCALYQTHKWRLQNFFQPEIPITSPQLNFLFWLPSYLKSHVIRRKLSKITHNPGTEITTQSFQNFTPGWLALWFLNGNRNLIDHLNLSPAPYLVTCSSPSLLAACSGASCFRIGFQLLWPQVPVKMATAAAWQPHRVPGALDQ